jgi:hypothetical protein
MSEQTQHLYDDEIDLRAVLRVLWKARILLLAGTVIPALLMYVFGMNQPPVYQATAYVFIGYPFINENASVSPVLPDIKSVAQMAVAPNLLDVVAQGQQVDSMSASAAEVGRDQLRLVVTDADPQRAAALANAWAKEVTAVVNATYYGVGGAALPLDEQVTGAFEAYEQAQADLQQALSVSSVDALTAELQNAQSELLCVLTAQGNAARMLTDAQSLETRWSALPADAVLSADDQLVLSTLSQRARISPTCGEADSSGQAAAGTSAVVTVSEGLAALAEARSALEARQTSLQAQQTRLAADIPSLQGKLEAEHATLTQAILMRDQTYTMYADLLSQQRRADTALAQNEPARAVVSVMAQVPQSPLGGTSMMTLVVAGMLGLVVVAAAVLAVDWWRKG